jgi:hypothetical protein
MACSRSPAGPRAQVLRERRRAGVQRLAGVRWGGGRDPTQTSGGLRTRQSCGDPCGDPGQARFRAARGYGAPDRSSAAGSADTPKSQPPAVTSPDAGHPRARRRTPTRPKRRPRRRGSRSRGAGIGDHDRASGRVAGGPAPSSDGFPNPRRSDRVHRGGLWIGRLRPVAAGERGQPRAKVCSERARFVVSSRTPMPPSPTLTEGD